MNFVIATIGSIYDIVKMIVIGTVMRLAMIAMLALSDVGLWLVLGAWMAAKL